MIDPIDVRDRAAADAEAIVRHFLGEPNQRLSTKRELRWGRHGSFMLTPSTGKWRDWETSERGDMADLVIREQGGDQRDAFKWLCRWLGVEDGEIGAPDPRRKAQREAEIRHREAEAMREAEAKRAEALAFWNEARPLLLSPAEAYLVRHRLGGREVPYRAVRSACLRFHPAPFSRTLHESPVHDEQGRASVGAMLAHMVDPATGTFVGVQRVFLDRDSRKIGRKMLGGSGIVQLARSRPGRLGLAEGIEDGLALLAEGWPGPAAMNAGNMRGFPVLLDVPALTIFPDRDPEKNGRRAGQDAAYACWLRWREAGRDVVVWWPKEGAKDFDEMLRERGDG